MRDYFSVVMDETEAKGREVSDGIEIIKTYS